MRACYDFHELLVIALCTVLCGGQGATDMEEFASSKEPFLRSFLELKNGLPRPRHLQPAVPLPRSGAVPHHLPAVPWPGSPRPIKVLSPSTARFSAARSTTPATSRPCTWSAPGAAISGSCWRRSLPMPSRDEITAVPKLLEMLTLKGTIVTVDALNCQRAIAQQIVEQGGDYVLALKGNQGSLHDDVSRFLDDPESEVEHLRAHGGWRPWPHRDAHRHGRSQDRLAAGGSSLAWSGRNRQGGANQGNHRQDHQRDSLLPAQQRIVGRTPHWGVENRLHWRLDVVMNEDQDRTRLGSGPQNLAVLRHMALNVMQKDTSKGSLRGKFRRAAWNDKLPRPVARPVLKCDCPATRSFRSPPLWSLAFDERGTLRRIGCRQRAAAEPDHRSIG